MACVSAIIMTGILYPPHLVAASTAVRADYSKDEHLLVMTDIIKTGETEPADSGRIPADNIPDGLSGSPGDASVMIKIGRNIKLPNPVSYYAITGIGLEEGWDKPCKLTLLGTLVDPRYQGETRVVARLELNKCKKSPGLGYKQISFSSSGKNFVRAIRVCRGAGKLLPQQAFNSLAWKIKGIQAFPSAVKVADSPTLIAEVTTKNDLKSFTRINCPEYLQAQGDNPGWDAWTQCPEGQVATGVRAYYYQDKYFTGLEISCQNVASRSIAKPPAKDKTGF